MEFLRISTSQTAGDLNIPRLSVVRLTMCETENGGSHHRSIKDAMVMKWFPFSLFSD